MGFAESDAAVNKMIRTTSNFFMFFLLCLKYYIVGEKWNEFASESSSKTEK